jgi:hypothetical protein
MTLNIHRSWTGYCIYRVEFERRGEKYAVRRVIANRAPDQRMASSDAFDLQLLHFVIGRVLLGKEVTFASLDGGQGGEVGSAEPTDHGRNQSQRRNRWWQFWKH